MEHAALLIRPYQDADFTAMERIHDSARRQELAFAGLDAAFVPLRIAAQREGLFDYTLRVAEQNGEVVGFTAYTQDELAWLYVDPPHMRKGIGRALASYVIEHTSERPLCVEVLAGNEPAMHLYTSIGFVRMKTVSGKMPGNECFDVTVHCLELSEASPERK